MILINDHPPFMTEPKVSVIIATLKEDKSFFTTVNSCLDQMGVDLEVVSFVHDTKYQLSSPAIQTFQRNGKKIVMLRGNDRGIADAWNEAVQYASGELLVFIGAGDIFHTQMSVGNALEIAATKQALNDHIVFYGTQFVRKNDSELHICTVSGDPECGGLLQGMVIPHASSFWPRTLFKHEKFDRNFKIALDYEYALRMCSTVTYVKIDCPVCVIEPGGLSNAPSRMIQVISEDARARIKNGFPSRYLSVLNFKRFIRWIIG